MAKGIGAAPGIAIGRAYVLTVRELELPDSPMRDGDLAAELQKLYAGIRLSKSELEAIRSDIRELIGEEEAHIFNAHLAILEDPFFLNEVRELMNRQFKAAEVAVKETIDKFVAMFDLLDDEYMKERAEDIKDVGNRLLKHLLGASPEGLPQGGTPYILVAKELTPSQLANLNPSEVLGMVTMMGGKTSHTAIMARAMGIPLVTGMESRLGRTVQTGDILVIDGDEGEVFVNPDTLLIEEYQNRKDTKVKEGERLQTLVGVPSLTRDGKRLDIRANITSLKELDAALDYGVSGVGLFRTEFIFMDRAVMPTEEEQFQIYRDAVQRLGGNPLIIRALDIGGDKGVSYIALPEEENPSLGLRAIRVLLERKDLFRTQLRAILRASRSGTMKILLPMVSSLEELHEAKAVVREVMQELDSQGVPYDKDIALGLMIEVPAAAALADLLAQECDFFSIGTNDLVQYMLAVDRMNETVAHLYDPFHPAILRLLKHTVEGAKRAGISVGVCGEAAGDPLALPVWIGLGIEEISMSAASVLPVKDRLIGISAEDCKRALEQAMRARTGQEIRDILASVTPVVSGTAGPAGSVE